jgi:CheY-like chemotaxis protein
MALPARQRVMRNRCILVVDDDDFVRAFIRRVLQNEQFAVIDFADPEDALAALPSFSHELSAIITDFTMPRINGVEFARKLAHRFPHIPILMISGSNEGPTEDAGLCFLGKPFGPRTLVQALRGLMNASRQLVPIALTSTC